MATALLLSAHPALAGDIFPRIVVTVAPLKPYVDEILKGEGSATNLLRPRQDPHNFAMTLPQEEMLQQADIIIVPDMEMSPFLKRQLAKNTHAQIIELSSLDGANPLPYASDNPWFDAMKTAQSQAPKPVPHVSTPQVTDIREGSHVEEVKPAAEKKPITDPHLWLDPERMAAIAEPLASRIADKAPEARATLTLNARTLATHLRGEVLPAMRVMLDKHPAALDTMQRPVIPFITYHAAYQYFLARFHLTHYGEITRLPQDLRNGNTLNLMIAGAKSMHLHCLIGEQPNLLMNRIATESDAQIILLSPEELPERKDVDALDWVQNDYDRFLYATAKIFSHCLGG